jgi:hypothetical protein
MFFICKATNHVVENCPVRKRPHQMPKYVGSAATGLGFYHIEIPEVVVNPVASTKNCGVVLVGVGKFLHKNWLQSSLRLTRPIGPGRLESLPMLILS